MIPFNIEEVSLDDKDTWDMICEGRVKGCFQIESNLGKIWCKEIKPRNIKELSDLIAIVRPGVLKFVYDGKSMAKHYADRKAGIEEAVPIHPLLSEFLGDTQNVLLYQEQIMKIAAVIAGFNEKSVQALRKSVGKKNAKDLFALQEQFVSGCVESGKLSKEEASLIFENIKKSARYLFNLSHSVSYSFITYWTAYLKCKYSEKFFKHWLRDADEKIDPDMEKRQLIMAARGEGIDIVGPHYTMLEDDFFWRAGAIHFGICNIKNIGKAHLSELKEQFNFLTEDQNDWINILLRVMPNVSKTAVENMIMCGAFSGLGKTRSEMIHEYKCMSDLTKKELDAILKNIKLSSLEEVLVKLLSLGVKSNGGLIHTESRFKKIEDILSRLKNPGRLLVDSPAAYAKIEEKLLSCPISVSELAGCADAVFATATCKEVNEGRSGFCSLAVILKGTREHHTKNDKTMAFSSAEDDTDLLEGVVLFPDVYEEFKDLIYDNSTVLLSGSLKNEKGRKSFIVEKVNQI